jgi:succinate-semialdehyde dehydrogenase/glutarate-semialdehyde dehydrogenase
MTLASRNPATGETIREYVPHDAAEVEVRVAAAHEAWLTWRRRPVAERAGLLDRAAGILEADARRWGERMALEMGKPIGQGVAEAAKSVAALRFYARHAEAFLAPERGGTEHESRIRFEPLGVVLAVMPWNFPLWQVVRFAAPALVAGNVGLLKHASNVPECALALEELFARAGFPAGCFATLLVGGGAVAAVIEDRRVAAVTLTGSEGAGAAVAGTAGRSLKKVVLELGGSDPFVVLPSADLASAAATAVRARTVNSGQSCIAAKRFVVHREVYDEFLGRFVAGMSGLRVGDPLVEATEVGPLASREIRDALAGQVERTVAAGARLALGGAVPDGPGWFYPPTVLVEAPAGSPARVEELFGPVATVIRVDDLDEAIAVANETRFGLGAAAWTRDERERERLVAELEAGTVAVNGMVASDPRLPFGGIKASGHGRELSRFGLLEFVNVKTVTFGKG